MANSRVMGPEEAAFYKRLGKEITRRRLGLGKVRYELHLKSKVATSTLGLAEQGRSIAIYPLVKLCKAFGCSVDEIIEKAKG
jgi:DNA-binding Xre family transcriptional regulator